jgi:AcrR family transcriptional regulator
VTRTPTQAPSRALGGSRPAILAAARQLFTEHGYAHVTVRQIAAHAGVSPGLVIKLMGSKAELYAAARPTQQPLAELEIPRERLGRALIERMLDRRDLGLPDGFATIAREIHEAPGEGARDELREELIERLAGLIGDQTTDRMHAATVLSVLIGLGTALRVLGLYAQTPREDLVTTYAPVLQVAVDACHPSPSAPPSRIGAVPPDG